MYESVCENKRCVCSSVPSIAHSSAQLIIMPTVCPVIAVLSTNLQSDDGDNGNAGGNAHDGGHGEQCYDDDGGVMVLVSVVEWCYIDGGCGMTVTVMVVIMVTIVMAMDHRLDSSIHAPNEGMAMKVERYSVKE